MSELTWTPDIATLGELELWDANPKRMSKARAERLLRSWEEMGQYQTLAIGPGGECYDGHQRIRTLQAAGYGPDYEVRVLRSSRVLTEQERRRVVAESTVGTIGALDWDQLASWDYGELADWGFDADLLRGWNDDAANLREMINAEMPPQDIDELWQGMPEFEQEDLSPQDSVKVNFATPEDRQAFAELVGQTITEKTKSIWYPKQEVRRFMDKRWDEDDES